MRAPSRHTRRRDISVQRVEAPVPRPQHRGCLSRPQSLASAMPRRTCRGFPSMHWRGRSAKLPRRVCTEIAPGDADRAHVSDAVSDVTARSAATEDAADCGGEFRFPWDTAGLIEASEVPSACADDNSITNRCFAHEDRRRGLQPASAHTSATMRGWDTMAPRRVGIISGWDTSQQCTASSGGCCRSCRTHRGSCHRRPRKCWQTGSRQRRDGLGSASLSGSSTREHRLFFPRSATQCNAA